MLVVKRGMWEAPIPPRRTSRIWRSRGVSQGSYMLSSAVLVFLLVCSLLRSAQSVPTRGEEIPRCGFKTADVCTSLHVDRYHL